MQKVLVTGGAGYIGSILVPELLNAGYHVTVIDNFMFGQNSLLHLCAHPNFEIVRGDVRLKTDMLPLLKKSDVIIPLAAYVGAPICARDPLGATSTNRDAIAMMCRHLSKAQQVLLPVTNSGYAPGNRHCTEKSKLHPVSLYARDKIEAEKIVLQRASAISFRLVTVFGMSPRMRTDLLVNDFVFRAMTERFIVLFESHFKRNFIHVRDVARVFLHGIKNFERMKGEAYNVGLPDVNLSKLELCEAIRKHLPQLAILKAPVRKDPDKRNYIVSNEKILKTGFVPLRSLDEGIRELIKGFVMLKNNSYGNF